MRICKGKPVALIAAAGLLLISMPADIAHLILVSLHTVYEIIAYAIEESLIHSLDISKFHAQMAVFYGSCSIGALCAHVAWRRLLVTLATVKSRTVNQLHRLRLELSETIASLTERHKAELMAVKLLGLAGGLLYLLA